MSVSDSAPGGGQAEAGIRRLVCPEDIRAALIDLGAHTTRELLSVLPHGAYRAEQLRSSWQADQELLSRGVAIRAVYPVEAARVPAIMEYLSDFARSGAHIRVAASIPHRLVIADRAAALLPAEIDDPGGPVLLLRQPVLVRSLYSDFHGLWKSSMPVGLMHRHSLDPKMIRETLSVLATGLTDEAASRQSGVSVRTLRRRIASVMELLSASSRFEAGIKAHEAGWV